MLDVLDKPVLVSIQNERVHQVTSSHMHHMQVVCIFTFCACIIASNMDVFVGRGNLVVRMSGSQSRELRFKSSCCRFEALTILFIPLCHSSLSFINEYLANSLCTVIAA